MGLCVVVFSLRPSQARPCVVVSCALRPGWVVHEYILKARPHNNNPILSLTYTSPSLALLYSFFLPTTPSTCLLLSSPNTTHSLAETHPPHSNYPTSGPACSSLPHTAPPGLPLSFPPTAKHSHNLHITLTHSQHVRNLRIHQLPRREGQKVHSRHSR